MTNVVFAYRMFEEQAQRFPNRIAVRTADEESSYAQLNLRANQLAREMIAHGVGPDRLVAIALTRSVDYVVTILAVHKAGGGYLPVDPDHPIERLRFVLENAAPVLVVSTAELASSLPPVDATQLLLDAPDIAENLTQLSPVDIGDAERRSPASLRDIAYVIYTSGSTGRPKGVIIEHYSLARYVARARQEYEHAAGESLVSSPMTFDLTVTGLFTPLVCGGCVNVTDMQDSSPLTRRPTFLKATPSHFAYLTALSDETAPTDMLILGGEPLAGSAIDEWRRAHPDVTVLNVYGQTETTVNCMEYVLPPGAASPAGLVPIGTTFHYVQAHVLDSSLVPVPPARKENSTLLGRHLLEAI